MAQPAKPKERLKDKKQRLKQWEERLREREEKLTAREIQYQNEWKWVQTSTGVSERNAHRRTSSSAPLSPPTQPLPTNTPVATPIVSGTTLDPTFPSIIKLNVGGQIFQTTLLTLTRNPDTMIAAMFSGRHPLLKDESGCYFLDRNPREFDIILRFLRSGFMAWPVDEQEKECLNVELDYFSIDEPDTSWMLRTDGFGGFKQYPYHEDIYLAVSKETNWQVVQGKSFDCPKGFHWASTREFKELIGDCTNDTKGYPYYDTGGWKGYVWEADTPRRIIYTRD